MKILNKIIEGIADKNDYLIVVDIQPEYSNATKYFIDDFIEFVNENNNNYNKIYYFYNGEELGMTSQSELIYWLIEQGLEEEVIDNIHFFDKGYGFFRYLIDNKVEKGDIVKTVKYMIDNDINDSREFNDKQWKELNNIIGSDEIEDLLGDKDGDNIWIPEALDFIKGLPNGIDVCGGGYDECLFEILVILKVFGKSYDKIEEFIY